MIPPEPRSWLQSLKERGIALGLARVRPLLRAMGNPHRGYPSIIVAGTNGKGSTAAMLTSILEAAGRHIGLFTSPALRSEREHWILGGEGIQEDLLVQSIREVQNAAARIETLPTYFEALTLTAFVAFARMERQSGSRGVDMAVLEVGMGGRQDATNIVKPIAALITPVSFDHAEFLGRTIRKIAREKAGVIHRGAITLTSNDDPLVLEILRRRAARFGNRLIHVTEEHETPLMGSFQRRNAGLAVCAARELGISEEAIALGIQGTRWRGRLERIDYASKEIWIDGGHNPHAAEAIAPFIEASVPPPRLLVFGIMSDKDVGSVAETLFPLFESVIATEPFPPEHPTVLIRRRRRALEHWPPAARTYRLAAPRSRGPEIRATGGGSGRGLLMSAEIRG